MLHVLNPLLPMPGIKPVRPPTYAKLQQASRAWAETQLKRLVRRARAAGVRATGILREGLEAEQISRLARSQRAAMIVMGTQGRTGIRRIFMGSVAARVLTLGPCPVLTVRVR